MSTENFVKFVSYSGKYPNRCHGVLTVEINGKEYKFGHEIDSYDWKTKKYKDNNFEKFWVSGGKVCRDDDWNMWSERDEWQLIEDYETNSYPA